MKRAYFFSLFFLAGASFAAPVKYVQISTMTTQILQPGTTAGFWTSSGTVNTFRASNLIVYSSATILSTNTFSGGNSFSSWTTLSGTSTIKGVSDGNNAAAGFIGEYISSATTNPTNFPTSGQYGDLDLIPLTAGDWDVGWNIKQSANGASITDCQYGVGTSAGNSAAGMTLGDNSQSVGGATAVFDFSTSVAGIRQSLSGSATIYLKYFCDYTVATPKATGRISARRAR